MRDALAAAQAAKGAGRQQAREAAEELEVRERAAADLRRQLSATQVLRFVLNEGVAPPDTSTRKIQPMTPTIWLSNIKSNLMQ